MPVISFAHFQEAEYGEELIDKKLLEGTLPEQVENTLTVVKTI